MLIQQTNRKKTKHKLLAWFTLATFVVQPALAFAQAVADPNAAAANRPVIDNAANNVPIVQIAAPSAAGVSHNLYQQLNIDPNGLIFNNSLGITSTQLAGYIAANPNLKGTAARIILNEVTGTGASYLKGYAEIAGQKADLIIANPNGIVGDGFGFINANRAVLTTGTPVFGGSGSLDAFRVTRGQITVQGKGIDATGADRLDLLSRAAAINAGLWAKDLNVVTGANEVDYSTLHTEKINGDGVQPTVALDVSALGGMYAHKIKLVGTEKGVGVNSQGMLAASSGNLTLTQEGKITLGGKTSASGTIALTGQGDIVHTGQLYGQTVTAQTTGTLTNSGLLAAAGDTTITAQTLQSTGTLGAGIKSDGKSGTVGNLTITTSGEAVATGRTVAAGDLVMEAASLDLAGGTTYAGQNASLTAAQGNLDNTGGTIEAGNSLQLTAQGTVANRNGGSLTADQITVTAANIGNHSGSISQSGSGATTLTAAQTLDNTNGKILTNGVAKISAKALYNNQGVLAAERGIALQADTLNNQHGTIASAGAVQLTATETITNTAGIIEAGHGLALTAGSLDNTSGGSITSLGPEALTVTVGGDLANQSGLLGGNGVVQVAAGSLDNQAGKVTAKDNLTIQSALEIDNTTGTLSAGKDISLKQTTGTLTNASGTIQAGQDITIATDSLASTGKLFASRDMTVTANDLATSGQLLVGRDVQLTAGTLLNQGTVQADGSVTLQVDGTLTNDGNVTALQGLAISGKDIQNSETGAIKSGGTLHLDATDSLTNAGTVYGKGELQVQAGEVTNTGALASASHTSLTADTLTSTGTLAAGLQSDGTLGTTGDLSMTTTGSAAAHGQTLAGGNLVIQGAAVDLSDGTTSAGNAAIITATEGDVDNTGGSLTAKDLTIQAQGALVNHNNAAAAGSIKAEQLTIHTNEIRNQGGTLVQYGQTDLTLSAANGIDNTDGQIATNSTNLTIDTSTFTNTHGQVQHAGKGLLTLATTGHIANDAGKIISNGALNLSAQDLDNTQGTLTAQRQVAITATSVDNTQGIIVGKAAVTLTAQGAVVNRAGTLEAGKGLSMTVRSLDNQDGSVTSLDDSGLEIQVEEAVTNEGGLIGGNGNVQITADSLANTAGRIVAKADLALQTDGDLTNTQGIISAGRNLTVEQAAGSLTNSQGTIQAGNDLTLTVSDVVNGAGELLANRDIAVQARTVQNSGTIGAGRDGNLTLQGSFTNESGSELQASRKLTLTTEGAITNQGHITAREEAALRAAELTITSDGTVKSGKAITMESDSLANAGTVYAKTDLAVEATGTVTNTGVVAAGNHTAVTTKELASTGTIAAGLQSDGTIGTVGDLNIITTGTAAAQGQTLAGNQLTLTGAAVVISGGTTYAGNNATITATEGDVDNTGGSLTATDLQISARRALVNNKSAAAAGSIKADQLTIHANEIRNKGGTLVQYGQTDLTLSAANGIDNTGGQIATNGTNLTIDTSDFTNTQGQVQHAGNGTLTLDAAGHVANDAGKLISNGALNLSAQDMDNTLGTITAQRQVDMAATSVDNTQGVIVGKEAITLTSQGAVINHAGTLEAGKGLSMTARSLDNQDGSVTSLDDSGLEIQAKDTVTNAGGLIGGNGNVQMAADSLDNTAGRIVAKADLALAVDGNITNTQGTLSAGHNLTVEQVTGSLTNNQGATQAGNDLTIHTTEIHNTAGRILANRDLKLAGKTATTSGVLYGGRDVQVTLEGNITNEAGGEILADRNLTLAADGTVTNSGKLTTVGDAAIRGGNLANTSGASLKSGQSLTLTTTGNLSNDGSIYAKEDVTAVSAGTLSNGGTMAAGKNTTLTAQMLDSTGTFAAGLQNDGTIGNSGDLTLITEETSRLAGQTLAGNNLSITAAVVDLSRGNAYAGNSAVITATAGDLDNTGGTLAAKALTVKAEGTLINNKNASQIGGTIKADKLAITANRLTNKGGILVQYGQTDVTLTADEGIDNTGGQIATNSTNLTIRTDKLINTEGQVQHAGTGKLTIAATGGLNNNHGRIIGNGALNLNAQDIDNTDGNITAQQLLGVTAHNLTNEKGVILGKEAVHITARGDASNREGTIEAGKSLTVTALSMDNRAGRMTSLDNSGLYLSADGALQNQAGFIGGNGNIAAVAGRIANADGQIQAKSDLTVTTQGDLDNTQGTLSAGQNLLAEQITGSFTNNAGIIQAGNDVTIKAGDIMNTAGRLLASQDLQISGKFMANSGIVFSGRDARVNLQNTFTNAAGGEVQADGKLTLTAGSILTNNGKVTALQEAIISGAGIVNSSDASLKSGRSLTASAAGRLANDGTIYANTDVALDSEGSISNTGMLVAGADMTMQAQAISSTGTLAAGIQFDGSLGSTGDLTVTAANSITMQGRNLSGHNLGIQGTSIDLNGATTYAGNTAIVTATNGDIDNSGGTLTAKEMTVSAQGAVKNNKNAANVAAAMRADKLNIAAKSLSNKGGTLVQYGQTDMTLTAADGIDNTGGQLATNSTNLSIETASFTNSQGQLQHAGTGVVTLDVSGSIDNTGGSLITNGTADLNTTALTNTQGKISAKKQVTIDADNLANSQGVLVAQDALQLNVQEAITNQAGLVEAGKGLAIIAQTVNNQNGTMTNLGTSTLSVTASDQLQNQSGLIGSNGIIELTADSLTNSSGKVQAKTDLTLRTANNIDNTQGSLSAGHDLTLNQTAGTFTNNQGAVQADNDLTVSAGAISNNAGRLLASRDLQMSGQTLTSSGTLFGGRDVHINLQGAFTNGAGSEIQADRNLSLSTSGTITNQGKMTALQDTAISGSTISNTTSGAVKSGNALVLNAAGNLINSGTVFAKTDLDVDSTGSITNTGVLAAARHTTIGSQSLTSNGTLAAGIQNDGSVGSTGDLTITTVGSSVLHGQTLAANNLTLQGSSLDLTGGTAYAGNNASLTAVSSSIDNTGATLEAKGTARLNASAGSLKNDKSSSNIAGTIRANKLDITTNNISNKGGHLIQFGTADTIFASNIFDNTGGQLATNGTNLTLTANTFINNQGQVQHAGTGLFSLQSAAGFNNTNGSLITNGAAAITAASVTNQLGTISAKKQLTLTANDFTNQRGILVTQDGLELNIQGNADNRQGIIEAGKGASISAQTLDNRSGSLTNLNQQEFDVMVTGAVQNQDGLIGGNGQVKLSAASLTNQKGSVQAQGSLTLITPLGIDNTKGTLFAGQNLTLQQTGSPLMNDQGKVEAGESLNVEAAAITNTAGRFAANQDVALVFTSLNGGTVQAGQDLKLAVNGAFTNETGNGWKANRDFTVAATGAITNRGNLEAGRNLFMSGSNVTNEAAGLLAANETLQLTTAGDVTNTGSVFGKDITVTANRIINANDTAAIAANRTVNLFAATAVENLDGATIYSQGDIVIAGSEAKDGAGDYSTRTGSLLNQSATIEADRDIAIYANEVVNRKREFVTEQVEVENNVITIKKGSYEGERYVSDNPYPTDEDIITEFFIGEGVKYSNGHWLLPLGQIIKKTYIIKDSLQGKILAGRDLYFKSNHLLNDTSHILSGNNISYFGDLSNIARGSTNEIVDYFAILSPESWWRFNGEVAIYVVVGDSYTETRQEEIPGATAIFGGGQSVTIQGTNVNNVTLTPGSVIDTTKAVSTSGHTSSATSQTGSNSPAATGVNTSVSGSSIAVNTGSGVASSGQTSSAAVNQAGGNTPASAAINTNISGGGVNVEAGSSVSASGQGSSAAVNQSDSNLPVPTGINTNINGSGVLITTGGVSSSAQGASADVQQADSGSPAVAGVNTSVNASGITVGNNNGTAASGQASNAAVSQGNTTTVTAQINTSVSTGDIPADNIQTLLPSAQTVPVNPPQTNNGGTITVPASGMYAVHTEPAAQYLVETNPRFTAYGNFLSSDYMLERLNIDPAATMKRLGDGFYEQKLVREQITDLTGRVYLSGYDSAEAQYKALLENGAAVAQSFQLQVGIALSDEQMKQLTTPIVWMVEQEVNGQKVLVPVVYLPQLREGDLKADGAVIAADSVIINASGVVTNAGTIKANEQAQISAVTVSNLGGTIDSGNLTKVAAAEDLFNLSGTITGNNVNLSAGQNFTNETVTFRTDSPYHSLTTSGDVATINAGENLSIAAGENVTLLGSSLSADSNLSLTAGNKLEIGSIANQDYWGSGNFAQTEATNLTASLTAGGNLDLHATDMTMQGGRVKAGENINLAALGSINITSVQDSSSFTNQYGFAFNNQAITTNQVSLFEAGKDLNVTVGQDLTLTGVQASAGENLNVAVGGDILLNAVKDSEFSDVKSGSSSNYKRVMTNAETVIGTNLAASKDLTINSGSSLTMEGSSAVSEKGKITITAADGITIGAVTETHEALTESKKTKSGFLSKKTTIKKDYSLVNEVVGSTISGDSVEITAGTDLTVQAGNIVGTQDVNLTAGNDLTIVSAAKTGAAEHYKYTKKSGLFSGGGLGFTIGSQSEKSTLKEQTLGEVGSTVGSLEGNITLTAGNQVNSAGTAFISGKDLDITGKTVNIDNTVDTYDSQSKYEFKQSGLSVSLNGGSAQTAMDAVSNIERASQVSDERLQALYAYKAYEDVEKLSKITDEKGLKEGVSVSVSIGSSKFTSEQTVHSETVNTSDITAGGTVTIKATEGDVNLSGVKLDAKDLTITAADNITIDAAQNKLQIDTNTSSSSWAVGASLGTNTSYFANASKGSGKENQDTVTQVGSLLNADGTVQLVTGKDLTISGSQVKGGSILADIGGDLNIVSLQDTDDYIAKNKNSGIGVSTGPSGGVTGSYSQGKTNSTYASVTEQAGIFAGEGGFDITVGGNTDLKGAVISSEATPDKNKLSTDTLTFSDIENKAEYSASSTGVNLDTRKTAEAKDAGLTPAIGTKATGDADSTTNSAIAEGTIEVRNGDTDLSNLSRDTANSLNALGKIFDKKTVAEQQELAKVFGEVTFKAIGDLAESQAKKAATDEERAKWLDGGEYKIALHALVGGIMSDMGGSSFASGAASAGVNEAIQGELSKIKDPALHQIASVLVGATAAKVAGGNTQSGASVAASGTKNNFLTHEQYAEYQAQLKKLQEKLKDGNINEEEYNAALREVTTYWTEKDIKQNKQWLADNHIEAISIEGDFGQGVTLITLNKQQYQQMLIELSNSKNEEETASIKEKWRNASKEQIDQWIKMGKDLGYNMEGSKTSLFPDLSTEVVSINKTPGIVKTFIYDTKASVTENAHKLLSIGGFTPLAPISEGANAIIYLAEGDNESAAMSAFAAIPGMKVLVVAKGAIKLVPETEAAVKFVQAYTKEVKAGENVTSVVTGSSRVVSNMGEFFQNGFGNSIKNNLSKSSLQYDGQTIYKVTSKTNNEYLKKGYGVYLDALHKDHLEVINKSGKVVYVLNLDGTLNADKTAKAIGRVIKGW